MPRLTRSLIDATAPGPREIVLRDDGKGGVPGFHVRVSPGGTKSYYLYYRTLAHRERRYKIARCDEMIPERARDIARDLLERVRRGGDPAAERDTARATGPGETFEVAVADYIEREQKGRRGNATADEVKRALLRVGNRWRRRPVASLTAAEIRKAVETLRDGSAESGQKPAPYMAVNTFAYLRAFFEWCAEPGIDKVPASPMIGLRKPWAGAEARDRVFTDDELRALWRAGDEIGGPRGAYLKVLLLLGKRRGALAAMQRQHIDDTGLWVPPGDNRIRRRNKRLHATPLPKLAQRIVAGVPARDGNPFVFYGQRRGKHFDPGSTFQDEVREVSGVADFFCHAARHTLETRLAELRIPPHIRDLVLDHAPTRGSGAGYDHHHYRAEMLEALEMWATTVERIVAESDGVVVLR